MEWIIAGSALLIFLVYLIVEVCEGFADKGKTGEEQVYNVLERLEGRKAVLRNCYIPKVTGGTTEIDLILLHESGIYVIESKNYSGWIFGNENQKYWTQSLPGRYGTTHKNRFYNPLWQNETHIRSLKYILGDNTIPYYSYVVFGDDCELKNVQLVSGNHTVTFYSYLLRSISERAANNGCILSDERMAEIYKKLIKFTGATEEQKQRHVNEIRKRQYPIVQQDGTWACPLCGGVLVPRVSKRGANAGHRFWGCSNYPRCHFIYNG